MKYIIPTDSIPNQTFSTMLNNLDVLIRLYTVKELLLVDISIDNTPYTCGVKCISGQSITSNDVEKIINGKLYFSSLDDSYPDYKELGTNCNLYYEEYT